MNPIEYWNPSHYEKEQQNIRNNCWQWVCLNSEVPADKDYCSRTVSGVPVVVWNQSGKIRAFKNVCLHRNSKIIPDGCGKLAILRCQYHGWEYSNDGQLCRIPDSKCFQGLSLPSQGLIELRIENFGDFILICFDHNTPSIRSLLGGMREEIDRHFCGWRLFRKNSKDISVNWKIVVENAVESYHVPIVHPKSFKTYRLEEWHDHQISEIFTRFHDLKPWSNSIVGWGYRLLTRLMVGNKNPDRMTHVHIFPNMLFYYGDLFSIFYIVEAVQPEKSRLRSFFYLSPINLSRQKKFWVLDSIPFLAVQLLMLPFLSFIFFRILKEDLRILQDVQDGFKYPSGLGVLGAREERVLAFQQYLKRVIKAG